MIVSPIVNLRNMWTGEWISIWKHQGNSLTGTIKICSHYFEEGNLQFSQTKDVSLNVNRSDIARCIGETEEGV